MMMEVKMVLMMILTNGNHNSNSDNNNNNTVDNGYTMDEPLHIEISYSLFHQNFNSYECKEL